MKTKHLAVILTLLSIAACTHQEIDRPSPADVFFAELENPGAENTRVYADAQLRVLWNNDDRITIFNKYTYGYQYRFKGRTGATAGKFEPVEEEGGYVTGNDLPYIYSVYPYQELTEIDNDGIITIDLPEEQTYAANSFGLGANTMVSISADNEMRFKNVGGYFGLQLYGDNVSVSTITLKGNWGEPLAGTANITPVFGSTPTMAFDPHYPTSETVTLVCPTPVRIGSTAAESTIFWIVVPPTVFSGGLTITVVDKDGCVFEKTTTKRNEIKRNTLLRMPAIEVVVEEPEGNNVIYYTTSDDNMVTLGGYSGVTIDTFGANIVSHEYTNGRGIIRFDGDVTSIGEEAFRYCDNLTSVSIPESVTSIGDSAFYGCYSLTGVNIPDGVTSIGGGAFFDCRSLTNVFIPESVMFIGVVPFGWCFSLSSFEGKYASTDGLYLIDQGTMLAAAIGGIEGDLVLPESVTSIGPFALSLCTNLVNITIPDSVTEIGVSAFFGCSSLVTITVLAHNPPYIDDRVFDETNNAPIYVPAQSLNAYKTAEYWSDYADRIQAVPSSVPTPEAVDMGLSVKWASFNLGASKPEEYKGDYYAWAETNTKTDYSWSTYTFGSSESGPFSKYNTDDNRIILETGPNGDDVANKKLGDKWRMPTAEEWKELWDNCEWTWTDRFNGVTVRGIIVTATNGNRIFLPAMGNFSGTALANFRSNGHYWSSSLSTTDPSWAQSFNFYYSSSKILIGGWSRDTGLPIRPVYDDTGFSVSPSSVKLEAGENCQLTALVTLANESNKTLAWSSSNTSVATIDNSGLVTAVAPGKTTITVTTNDGSGISATSSVVVRNVPDDAVDLGLSVYWAMCNLGASEPEEYGDHYAWGETTTKSNYSWSTYQFSTSESGPFSKYNTKSSYGPVDNKTVLDAGPNGDDVASKKLGDGWRMPSVLEWKELLDNCYRSWTNNYNGTGVAGTVFTSKKTNRSIFLPAAGQWFNLNLVNVGNRGLYWSSSITTSRPNEASCVVFDSEEFYNSSHYRFAGLSIRPVLE